MRKLLYICSFFIFLGFSTSSSATLIVNGEDAFGNRLIYDTDLNVTWYDFSSDPGNWLQIDSWASNLSVTDTYGVTYTEWRLASTPDELWHLNAVELQNGPGSALSNMGPFRNLLPEYYWTETNHMLPGYWYAYYFDFFQGEHGIQPINIDAVGLAVHDGNIGSPVPEPSTILLLSAGLIGAGIYRRKHKKS